MRERGREREEPRDEKERGRKRQREGKRTSYRRKEKRGAETLVVGYRTINLRIMISKRVCMRLLMTQLVERNYENIHENWKIN